MDWKEIREWSVLAIAAIPLAWLAIERVIRKSFATVDTVSALATVTKDAIRDLQSQITAGRHAQELLEKDVNNLPNYREVNELKKDIGGLKEEAAANGAKLELSLGKLDRIDEFLRARP